MDRVHSVDNKPWISDTAIHLKDQISRSERQLKSGGISQEKDQNPGPEYSNLSKKLDEFVKKNDDFVRPCFLFNSFYEKSLAENNNCTLKTYSLQLEHARKMISDRAYKFNYLKILRTKRKEMLMRHLASSNKQTHPEISMDSANPSPGSLTAIIVVQMWPQPSKTNKIRLEKEVLFRADQSLTELREQFKCQRDYGVPMDLSENPDQAERIYRGEIFKSGFFLIGDTFYDDLRDRNNTELSRVIVNWSEQVISTVNESGENVKVSRGIGPFKRSLMESSKFEDIEFKLGYPYLYLHQGDCEHLFTISDIKYVPYDKDLQKTKFPCVTATSIGRKEDYLKCYICRSLPPHWYTRNNSRLPMDPFFFCDNCFFSFNYTVDKKKIGDFQAYLYTSPVGIPDSVTMTTERT